MGKLLVLVKSYHDGREIPASEIYDSSRLNMLNFIIFINMVLMIESHHQFMKGEYNSCLIINGC